jgi:hypothetical protein
MSAVMVFYKFVGKRKQDFINIYGNSFSHLLL